MRWQQLEYLGKGLFLGLLLYTALQHPARADLELQGWCLLGGLTICLAVAAVLRLKQGYQIKGRYLTFILFLLLESPALTYLGILGGMTLAACLIPRRAEQAWLLPATLVGGMLIGLGFAFFRLIHHRWTRIGISLALALTPVVTVLAWQYINPGFLADDPRSVGIQLLLGIPFFYLLTFAGRGEESEVEIGAICATLTLGLWLWQPLPNFKTVAVLVPAALYLLYTTRMLPQLRLFKHILRGLSHLGAGRHRQALQVFRRAVELDPKNKRARDGLWAVHRSIDLPQAAKDPSLANLIDAGMCLDRAGSLLIEAKPTPEQIQEADNLLDFVLNQRPQQRPSVLYWRSIIHLKTDKLDEAQQELTEILEPPAEDVDPRVEADRETILLRAWQLALLLHPEMQKRVGAPQLAIPGRRMEAIAAIERRLAEKPDNPPAWDLKRLLYASITEEEYKQKAGTGTASDFDHAYVQQLGQALISDPSRWQRGAEFLRMAVRGLFVQAPSIYVQIARAADQGGQPDAAWHYYRQVQQIGLQVGAANLPEEDRKLYFSTVKMLAEDAARRDDLDAAIDSYSLLTQSDTGTIETLRTLAVLYEKKKDVFNALRVTEKALLYNSGDKDLLEKKDKYYYSIFPQDLKPHLEAIKNWFDVAYCLKKSSGILTAKSADLDMIDWALHLAMIAAVVQPNSISAKVLEARARLRKGERDAALQIFEDLREQKPESFPSGDDEEAWYLAQRLLGDLYLNEVSRPDLAIGCYLDFRKSSKSGADTLYKLGQAYEGTGDAAKAAKFYEAVTSYEGHPLAYDARQALYRVKGG
jgi:tetratricopeptide (TPR) repeat protein